MARGDGSDGPPTLGRAGRSEVTVNSRDDDAWTAEDGAELYQIPGWGGGMYRVDAKGRVRMVPADKPEHPGIDLKQLADDMKLRGVELPLLVRFTDVIRTRIDGMVAAFASAIADWDYTGRYRPVFPVKVNPQSHVMHDIMTHGRPHHVGLEAGSKPELMAVLSTLDDLDALIVCNGYKDEAYVRMALLARRLGHEIVIVLEKPDELDTILAVADDLGVEPLIGIRARLKAGGMGHWATSSGDHAKFGLSLPEMVDVVERLEAVDRLGCLQLLHFHIGSQVSHVRTFRTAVREAARIYGELHRLGAGMRFLDVGGGLGVDYDGTKSTDASSINYDLREYAHAVVGTVSEVCAENGAPHPHLITESGRAMVAHHSVLLLEVVGTNSRELDPPDRPEGEVVRTIEAAWEIHDEADAERLVESLHDIQSLRREAVTRFNLGLLSLRERAHVEQLYWATCRRVLELGLASGEDLPEEVADLRTQLVDTYFCNFSVFQSLPDIWAIDQLFPIAPIHRLGERPVRRAILADLTCDSDGKIDCFIGPREQRPYLELHPLRDGERYVIGVFLVGAYQEILGDLHNLFGDTHAIHVAASRSKRGYTVLHLDEGDIVEEVLGYVHHRPKELVKRLRNKVEKATDEGRMSIEDGAELVRTFVRGLDDYTYLAR